MQKENLFLDKSPADFMDVWFREKLLNDQDQSIFNRYYKDYYKNFTPFLKENYNERLREAIDFIKSKKGELDILDIGAGCGSESLYFSSLGCNVLGIDLDQSRLNAAKSRKKIIEENSGKKLKCEFELTSVFDLDERKFDLIWIMETLHHIEPREKFVSLLPQFLNDDGCLVISESNASNPLIQLLMFKTRGFSTKRIKRDAHGIIHQYGRERIVRGKTLKKILEKSGICCQNIRYFRILNFQNPFLATIGRIFPQLMKPLFVHYNFIGAKKKTK